MNGFTVPQKGDIEKIQRGKAIWYMKYGGKKWHRCKKPKDMLVIFHRFQFNLEESR